MLSFRRNLKWIAALASLGLAAHLQAAPITLAPGSTVSAHSGEDNGADTTDNVDALPFTKTTTAIDGDVTSTVLSTLTTSKLNFDFTQNIPDFFEASGTGDIFFTAGQGVTFSIAGFQTTFGGFYSQELATRLTDITTGAKLYDYDVTDDVNRGSEEGNTLTLDSTGGSLTGSLIEGHLYEFEAFEGMEVFTDPTGNGTVSISFAQQTTPGGPGPSVPLPPALPAALLATLIIAGAMRLRKQPSHN